MTKSKRKFVPPTEEELAALDHFFEMSDDEEQQSKIGKTAFEYLEKNKSIAVKGKPIRGYVRSNS